MQAAYHSVRDSYQFTAELRKVLHSLPPQAARATREALRDPPAGAAAGAGSAPRGKKRDRWNDAPPFGGQGVGPAAGEEDSEEELTYMTQVRFRWHRGPLVLT